MKEYLISDREEKLTLFKYLLKRFPEAPASILHKQIRNKNITVNGKKAKENQILEKNDVVKVFFSDETIIKFEGSDRNNVLKNVSGNMDVLYEDTDILIANKPAGILTQKAKESDVSLNEELIGYLLNNNKISTSDLKLVRPSVCNRLDRNTSGIVLCGKTIKGLQFLSEILKERTVHKYYRCIVKGTVTEPARYEGYLNKNFDNNIVEIRENKESEDDLYISTSYRPIESTGNVTVLEVLLETGRAHQIRAHLAYLGHPIIGDPKYGDEQLNRFYRDKYKIKRQMLHAYRIELPASQLYPKGLVIECPLPEDMKRCL